MKITIKTDPETMFLLHRIVLDNSQTTGPRRSCKSMVIELFEKFSKHCISYTGNPNGKPRSIELRYHLADKLLELVKEVMQKASFGTFEHNKLEMFKNDLHQKLL